MSIVLGPGGGALNPFINLARTGFGGPMGDGDPRFSWAHVDDVVAATTHTYGHPEVSGPVNVAAPEVLTNAELMRHVRATLGRPAGSPCQRGRWRPAPGSSAPRPSSCSRAAG
jgi:NAD dependent epimerase/dehydratase family enzyme